MYPEGLKELFEYPSPKEDDVFLMTILFCPKKFHEDYFQYSKSNDCEGLVYTIENSEEIENNRLKDFIENQNKKIGILNVKKELPDNQKKISKKLENSNAEIQLLKKSIERLSFGSDDILEILLEEYKRRKSIKIKKENPELYKEAIEYLKIVYPNEENLSYYEFSYEDYLLIICSIIKYFNKIKIRLELGDLENNIFLILYADEKQYESLAEKFEYELQLKPYAFKYEYYRRELNKTELLYSGLITGQHQALDYDSSDKAKNDYVNIANSGPIQFEYLHFSQPFLWPPYCHFDPRRKNKFRRYEKNDLYHECPDIPIDQDICDKSSIFRNIDKIRLLNMALDKCLRLTYMKKKNVLNTILYKRNFVSYGDKLSFNHLMDKSYNIFSLKDFLYLINLIRNYYGETIAYYFIWLEHYIQWLLFPGIVGIIVAIFIYLEKPFNNKAIKESSITPLDIFLMVFSVVIIIWATLFLKTWEQKEKKYAFIFGTENFKSSEPDSELFDPDYEIEFVFGEKIHLSTTWIHNLKRAFSYLVLVIMISSTCAITYSLLHHKKKKLKEDTKENYWYNTSINMVYASINAIQIKIFNYIYTFLATRLNKWENYKKDHIRLNDLAIKIIIFDFMNCYSSGFYIGFVKPALNEPCVGTCLRELETQLYTTYLINFALNIFEIATPYLMYKFFEYNYKKNSKHKIEEIKTHSVIHQLLCNETSTMIYEYNEMIINFGYVCLFSVTAPLTPIILLILVWVEKLVDVFKIFFLVRISIIEEATGINIYNILAKSLMFIGMLTNIGMILFSKDLYFSKKLSYKLFAFICVENCILFLMYFLDYNLLPKWFDEEKELKELYDKKYFLRRGRNLPHSSLLNKQKKIEEDAEKREKLVRLHSNALKA